MTMAPFPEFLSGLLATLEREAHRYVVYRDDSAGRRLVIRIDTAKDSAAIETALRSAGFSPTPATHDDGIDYVLHQPGTAVDPPYLVHVKGSFGSGKTAIANLLWRAATDESAVAARGNIRHDEAAKRLRWADGCGKVARSKAATEKGAARR